MALTDLVRLGRLVTPEIDIKRTTRPGDAPTQREFESMFAPFDGELRLFVRRRVNEPAVDDVMQDVRVAAFASLGTYRNRSSLRTWLYGIALNKCRDHYRTKGRESLQVSLDQAQELSDSTDDHSATDLHHTVLAALDHLSQSQREVLELYYYGEFTLLEISTTLNRNLNTVKYQFYRAHAELADLLGKETP